MLTQVAPEVTPALVGLVFTEGILAFLSPCILPMLPIYLMYLCGNGETQMDRKRLIVNTLGFIAGFTIVFVLLGATASGLGSLIKENRMLLQRVSGVIMIVFGLNFTGLVNIPLLNCVKTFETQTSNLKFFSSMVFGAAFSFGWTPCLGAFLGAALLLASNAATLYEGVALLFVFSLGLGIPFFVTALLWERLQGAMQFVKRHMRVIQIVSGAILIIVGILMVFDLFGYYMGIFS